MGGVFFAAALGLFILTYSQGPPKVVASVAIASYVLSAFNILFLKEGSAAKDVLPVSDLVDVPSVKGSGALRYCTLQPS